MGEMPSQDKQDITGSKLSFFDHLKVGRQKDSSIIFRERGTEAVTKKVGLIQTGSWLRVTDHIEKKLLQLSGFEEKETFVFVVRDSSKGDLWVEDIDGNRLPEFDGDIEIVTYASPSDKDQQTAPLTPEFIHAFLEMREQMKQTTGVFDAQGKELAAIDYLPKSSDIIEIRPAPYTNVAETAEQPDEYVYVTDAEGHITKERLTRQDARNQGQRYLIVTSLIFHEKEMLVQERSAEKKIDPGKMSASAHGVAKELIINGQRVENTAVAAIINTALEMNEELRHGRDATPFRIKIWPGTKGELVAYAEKQKIDDPNTVWLVSEALLQDDGYPMGSLEQKRTRAISTGFIFSKAKPPIFLKPPIAFDPAEVANVEWKKMSELVHDPWMTADVQSCTNAIVDQWIAETSQSGELSMALAKKALHNFISGIRRDTI